VSAYHTALVHGELEDAAPCHSLKTARGSRGFTHDLQKRLPGSYQACDVVYADLPWRHGLAEFDRRAGSHTDWRRLMQGVDIALADLKCPVLLTGGRNHAKLLPRPQQELQTVLHKGGVRLFVYNAVLDLQDGLTVMQVLGWLAERFSVAGDFCCGYGNTARVFAQAGKRFVVSDHNARCIGYIAEQAEAWESGPALT